MIDPNQIYLAIPRFIEALIFYLCAHRLIQKQKSKNRSDAGYVLAQTYIYAFISWSFYMILDILVSGLAFLSITQEEIDIWFLTNTDPFIISGYNLNYPSVFLCNLLRDSQLVCGYFFIVTFYKTTLIIKKGTEEGNKKFYKEPAVFFFLIVIMLLMIAEVGKVVITQESLLVTQNWDTLGLVGWVAYYLYFGGIVYVSWSTIVLYIKNNRKLDSTESVRLRNFSFGFLFYAIGFIYWILIPMLGIIFSFEINNILFNIIGHSIWACSPIAFYRALNPKLNAEIK
jgi:hypothetical protein